MSAEVTSAWNGDSLKWTINGEVVSDYDLRRWCANNGCPVLDVIRVAHVSAWANRTKHCVRCAGRKTVVANNLLGNRIPCPACLPASPGEKV